MNFHCRAVAVGVLATLASSFATHPHAAPATTPPPALAVQHVDIVVTDTRIHISHDEFVPRFARILPNSKIVRAGETWTIPAGVTTYDALEVEAGGVLRCSPDYDAELRVFHAQVLPGGSRSCQTHRRVTFVLRDGPLNTSDPNAPTYDPKQWGHGWLVFGPDALIGAPKTEYTEMQDADAGALSVTVDRCDGWAVGDTLRFPDMTQRMSPRRETPNGIASITALAGGCVVGLVARLDFDHHTGRDPNGAAVLRPVAENWTRNIVVRSENPLSTGTRGHSANIGDGATWVHEYVRFFALGRTCNESLDTCQAGRYADHKHGAQGFGSRSIGNVYEGAFGSKWGAVVHMTHDARYERNMCTDYLGACFVLGENGTEVRLTAIGNAASYTIGNGNSPDGNVRRNMPGTEGAGFWHRAAQGVTFVDNRAYDNFTGINHFNAEHIVPGTYPSVPGGPRDATFDPRTSLFARIAGSKTWGNRDGLETWGPVRIEDEIHAFNAGRQIYPSIGSTITVVRTKMIGDRAATKSIGMASSSAYIPFVEVIDSEIRGVELAAWGFAQRGIFRNVVVQSELGIKFTGHMSPTLLANVRFESLPGYPDQFVNVRPDARPWTPADGKDIGPFLERQEEGTFPQGSPYEVINWNGTGIDCRLYATTQEASLPAWPAYNVPVSARQSTPPIGIPQEGLTNREAFLAYSRANRGAYYEPADVLTFPGLINGVCKPGLDQAPAGVSRLVLTLPNLFTATLMEQGAATLWFTMTGAWLNAADPHSDRAAYSIDDGPWLEPRANRNLLPNDRRASTTATSDGTHTVRTVRLTAAGAQIEESRGTYAYVCTAGVCGPGTATQPPPAVDSDGDGVNDDKDLCPGTPPGTQVDANGCAAAPPAPTWDVLFQGTLQQLRGSTTLRFCPANQPESACVTVTVIR